MRRGFASTQQDAGSRRSGRVAACCALLRIVSWLPLWVRSWRVARATLNGGGFQPVRSCGVTESRTVLCGRGWRGRSTSAVGNGAELVSFAKRWSWLAARCRPHHFVCRLSNSHSRPIAAKISTAITDHGVDDAGSWLGVDAVGFASGAIFSGGCANCGEFTF